MKLIFLKPRNLRDIIGGGLDNPSCRDDSNDDGDNQYPGGPTIFIPGFPPIGG
ncbi:MAG: hypothetical protein AB8H12_08590 [Lewinella sp.]